MSFFLRFTETPNLDLKNNESYHLSEIECDGYYWNDYFNCFAMSLGGLCAFELDAETEEEAIEEAKDFYFDSNFNSKSGFDSYCILKGEIVGDCPEGVVIRAIEIVYIEKREYYKEN